MQKYSQALSIQPLKENYMYNSKNPTLSKDTIFKALNHTNINLLFSTRSSLEDISVIKAKEALQKMLNKNSSSLFSITKRVEV
jgi:hypothetical protein